MGIWPLKQCLCVCGLETGHLQWPVFVHGTNFFYLITLLTDIVSALVGLGTYVALILTFLPRDASADRGDATVSRPSVCPSVCPSVTFRYRVQISWNSSKIISRPNSLRPLLWLTPNMGDLVQREHPEN